MAKRPLLSAMAAIMFVVAGCAETTPTVLEMPVSETPTANLAGQPNLWDGGIIYVDPASVTYQGDPQELPSYITHDPRARPIHSGYADIEASECYVDEDGNAICMWPISATRSEASASRPGWFGGLVAGVIGGWIYSNILRPGAWDGHVMEFISEHCDVRGMETSFTANSEGEITDWECVGMQ